MSHKVNMHEKNITQSLNKPINILNSIKKGAKNGIVTTWILAKIMIPVYLFVTFLKHTPLLGYISELFAPLMNILGLPGESAIILVLGNIVNLYAAVGAAASFSLTAKQITILAVILSFSHSLFMETAVAKKTGVNIFVVLAIRLTLALLSGIMLNALL